MAARPKPPVVQPGVSSILVNPVQRGNPLLSHIRHVAYQFAEIAPDYQVGSTTCVLFLSLKYHRLHPEYIHGRIEKIQGLYGLRILLLVCDVTEHQDYIRELTRICLINNLTIMVAWTLEEAGVYLSTYKLFEHKPPDLIKERVDNDYDSRMRAAFTSIKGVNKTDVMTLKSNFGSFSNIAHATPQQLLDCPGFGALKVRRLKDAMEKPFKPTVSKTLRPALEDERRQSKAREPSPDWPELDIELDLN
ncbi:DNA excision repair protein ERCC-1 [Serendipita indica DSM 11827]|uniref:DNA excision repair protein ERCC-1 n=1 Tax=Serendipita indica (strain DSM 11827) TaxID=1109443 RepID=G4TN54_SERID|nr:DNA excision repair protein ERCC-1 [Serendipita indica DSM 11827]CCA72747.1 related to dna excision repair protein ercc-1 [Serendipita indica DSM 11827]